MRYRVIHLKRFSLNRVKGSSLGFTYLSLLFMIVVVGIALSVAAELYSTAAKREKEEELLFRGNQIRHAIRMFYEESQVFKRYPRELEELVKDPRFLAVKRHLRRIYEDPMTGKPDWQAIRQPDGTMIGVKSRSQSPTLKRANFPAELANLAGKTRYNEWEFKYVPKEK